MAVTIARSNFAGTYFAPSEYADVVAAAIEADQSRAGALGTGTASEP